MRCMGGGSCERVWGQKGELSSSPQWTEMTRLILRSLTTFAVIAFSSATALSQDDDQRKSSKGVQMGVDLGVRAGYAVPVGEVAEGFAASDFIAGQVPLWLDVGGRIERHLVIGGYFSWGVGIAGGRISSSCDSTGSSCTLRDLRYGAQVSWHASPGERSDFWFGLGLGLESLGLETQASSGFDAHESLSLVGLELPRLELGVDVPLSKYFVAGPFFAFSMSEFDDVDYSCSGVNCPEASMEGAVAKEAHHYWFFFGLRAAFVSGTRKPPRERSNWDAPI